MVIEIANPKTGETISDGEYGEIVFTTLKNIITNGCNNLLVVVA